MSDGGPIWDQLRPEERAVFSRIVFELGLNFWESCPPLKSLIPTLVVHRAASELVGDHTELSFSDALADVAQRLELGSDQARKVRLWKQHEKAVEAILGEDDDDDLKPSDSAEKIAANESLD